MHFLYLYNSVAYRVVRSPVHPDWAFYVNCRVPRSIRDQGSTNLIRYFNQFDIRISADFSRLKILDRSHIQQNLFSSLKKNLAQSKRHSG